jgi:outer membrane protein, heavy metal efflux system
MNRIQRVARTGRRLLAVLSVIAALLSGAPAHADSDTQDEVLTLTSAVALAVDGNPGLDELRQRAQAAAAMPSQAGSLPDPRITLGTANLPVDSFALGQEPMTQLQLGISQSFPFPGKLALRREMAESEAAAAADTMQEAQLRLVRDVRNAWWELFYLDRAASTIERNRDLLRQLVDVARVKFEVGRGLQQDVLLAQVELARLQDLAIQIAGMRATTSARMNALLARPAEAPVLLPATFDAALPKIPTQAQLEAQAEQSRAWLGQARHQLDAARSAQELARKEYFPEFGVSVNYGWREGRNADGSQRADFATAMLSFSVPLFAAAKQDHLVAQRRAESSARERALEDARNRVRADISVASADYRRTRDELSLLDAGILPQTRQAVASMLAGYQVNKVDFLTLVRTQITLYNYETQRWRAFSQAHQALATLTAAVGQERFDD